MTKEQIALARRAVSCKSWRWLPGMQFIHRHDTGPDVWYPRIGRQGEKPVHAKIRKDVLPMLEDAATLGCLLALVREAHGKPLAFAFSEDEGMWEIGVVRRYYDHFVDTLRTGGSWGYTEGQDEVVYEPSEAHVLVRALEVADAFHATKETA